MILFKVLSIIFSWILQGVCKFMSTTVNFHFFSPVAFCPMSQEYVQLLIRVTVATMIKTQIKADKLHVVAVIRS